ncbi:VOC family protein [Neobacillus sp. PS2-9]|uniref:VOC family protein n=1 Tax=Neobacillus sp. PS2-9 TaxID=3070676 RepID=UPI0027E177C7|nr:VOC family protein [Neobacillus sp. PS2-9]WML56492.1 VOC family protein [Neobacillus sp. PS2-9]
MKLTFLFHPVKNLKDSIEFYRDTLGFEESWREGEHTAALKLPGSDVQLMLEDEDENDGLPAGGIFLVESVDQYYAENNGKLVFIKEPIDIPPGRYAIYQDNSGNPIRILDFSKDK